MAKQTYVANHEIVGVKPHKRNSSNSGREFSENSSYAGDLVQFDDKNDAALIAQLIENDAIKLQVSEKFITESPKEDF